ncbi:MAG: alpha/beta hydrolase [Sandaracinaceae bacterium]|nr:alpha/beta hydrolase [Sandaracinaceae bacterium]
MLRSPLALALAAAAAAGCRPTLEPPRPSVDVEVGYVTTRERTGTSDPRRFYGPRVGEPERGRATVRLPHDPRRGERPTGPPVRRSTLVAIAPGEVPPAEGDELVFVHGHDVTFPDAARRGAQLAYDVGFEGRTSLFAWASGSTYGTDDVRAARSGEVLAGWLLERARHARVHVVAHSLGARVVVAGLVPLATTEPAPHFGELILVAPDVDADEFVERTGPRIAPLFDRVTVYASSNERALHHDFEAAALGDAENGVRVDARFETIDASAVDTSLLGHALDPHRRSVVTDIAALLAGGPRPERMEQRIGRATYWTLEGPPLGDGR